MPRFICHHEGRWNIYTTVADGFCFIRSLSIDELRAWYQEEYGRHGLDNLQPRIDRALVKGTSSLIHDSLEQMLDCNRAGENETELTAAECIRRFLS